MGIVYHYTGTEAFKGVIEKAALWATDFRYLNDSGELIYTWAAFVERGGTWFGPMWHVA